MYLEVNPALVTNDEQEWAAVQLHRITLERMFCNWIKFEILMYIFADAVVGGAVAPAWFGPALAEGLAPLRAQMSNMGRRKQNRHNRAAGGLLMPLKQVSLPLCFYPFSPTPPLFQPSYTSPTSCLSAFIIIMLFLECWMGQCTGWCHCYSRKCSSCCTCGCSCCWDCTAFPGSSNCGRNK
jgi:hypothetical protein